MTWRRAIPAFPVVDVKKSADFYAAKLGFKIAHLQDGFARLERDDVELHLWASSDASWRSRADVAANPVCSGAETFIAGTVSCRVEVDEIDALYRECQKADVLHSNDTTVVEQPWGCREFHVVDLHRNLITFFQRIR